MKQQRIPQLIFIVGAALVILFFHFSHLDHHTELHSLHYRLNYIPILAAAIWFGLKGGIISSGIITMIYLPCFLAGYGLDPHSSSLNTSLEFVLYNVIGWVAGWLVSRRIKAEEESNRSKRLAELGEFAAGVVHEIKNPLQTIQGAVELLRRRTEDAESRQILDAAGEESARLDRFARDFLSLARPPEPRIVNADLAEIIRKSIGKVRISRAGSAPELTISFDAGRLFAPCDPELIGQVIRNLLDNAAAATGGQGSILIDVLVRGGTVLVTVSDSGPGVPLDEREKIFLPFRSKHKGGTGLGLPISRAIVEAHHGKIVCMESPLGGASFLVELPR